MSNLNPSLWLTSPFTVSEPSNNDLVFIVDANGNVLTEVLPGAIRGIKSLNPDKAVKLKLAQVIVECLNTVLSYRQERADTQANTTPARTQVPVPSLVDWGLVSDRQGDNQVHGALGENSGQSESDPSSDAN